MVKLLDKMSPHTGSVFLNEHLTSSYEIQNTTASWHLSLCGGSCVMHGHLVLQVFSLVLGCMPFPVTSLRDKLKS